MEKEKLGKLGLGLIQGGGVFFIIFKHLQQGHPTSITQATSTVVHCILRVFQNAIRASRGLRYVTFFADKFTDNNPVISELAGLIVFNPYVLGMNKTEADLGDKFENSCVFLGC